MGRLTYTSPFGTVTSDDKVKVGDTIKITVNDEKDGHGFLIGSIHKVKEVHPKDKRISVYTSDESIYYREFEVIK